MRIGFVVNQIKTEKPRFTTVLLAYRMHQQKHDAFFLNVADLEYYADDRVGGCGVRPAGNSYKKMETYLRALQSDEAEREMLSAGDLDVIFLRNDPSIEPPSRYWAKSAGFMFGQAAARQGVIVVNDPFALANAATKLNFQNLPAPTRPRTIISRDAAQIRAFIENEGGDVILKPLEGSGGKNVFVVKEGQHDNLNQIIENLREDGYIVVQEYVPQAADGDIRLFVMNGDPLQVDGKFAALRRSNDSDDPRSNMHVGGRASRVAIDDGVLELAAMIRPYLVESGLFLVGLDIVGDKLLEVNAFSPGGLYSCCELQGVDFTAPIIAALQKKVEFRRAYGNRLRNRIIAAL